MLVGSSAIRALSYQSLGRAIRRQDQNIAFRNVNDPDEMARVWSTAVQAIPVPTSSFSESCSTSSDQNQLSRHRNVHRPHCAAFAVVTDEQVLNKSRLVKGPSQHQLADRWSDEGVRTWTSLHREKRSAPGGGRGADRTAAQWGAAAGDPFAEGLGEGLVGCDCSFRR